jgi:hypothetical protein
MSRGVSTRLAFLFAFLSVLFVGVGCGEKPPTKTPSPDTGMDDAFALLPANAIAVGTVDGRAFFGSKTFGSELAKLVEKYLPIGQEAGFQASRDVDRVTFASYAFQGVDAAAVIIGKFDEAKIKQVALQHTPTKNGGMLVASQYAGRDVYTINNVGFTILSPTKAIAGSESGIRRVLERIKDGRVKRDITPWMIETAETPGAAAAFAVDLATHPMTADAMRQVPVAFIQSATAIRVLLTFKEPGVQVAGSFTYADAQTAQASSEQIKHMLSMSSLLSLINVKLQNIDLKIEKQDVQVKLEIDDQSLRQMLSQAPQWLGQ